MNGEAVTIILRNNREVKDREATLVNWLRGLGVGFNHTHQRIDLHRGGEIYICSERQRSQILAGRNAVVFRDSVWAREVDEIVQGNFLRLAATARYTDDRVRLLDEDGEHLSDLPMDSAEAVLSQCYWIEVEGEP